jgi:diacylglycerol kinase (ATP)
MTNKNRWLTGYLNYYYVVLKSIASYLSVPVTYSFNSGPQSDERVFMITVANGSRYGGNFLVAPGAKPDDGLLDFVLVKSVGVLKRYYYLPGMKKGKHLSLPFVEYSKINSVKIVSQKIVAAHLDGELMMAKEFDISVLPGKFWFRY